MLRLICRLLVFLLLGWGGLDLGAVEIQSRVDFASRYIWRGFDLNPYREPVIQPSIGVNLPDKGFEVILWSSFSFVSKEMNEIDLTVSYSQGIGESLAIRGGLIHYGWYFTGDFRLGDDTSQELFVAAEFSRWGLQSALTLFYDFTNGDGFYGLAAVQYPVIITRGLGAGFQASLGYNGGQWLAEGTRPGFSDLNAGITADWSIGPFLAGVKVNYTVVLLKAIGRENHIYFGFSIGHNCRGE